MQEIQVLSNQIDTWGDTTLLDLLGEKKKQGFRSGESFKMGESSPTPQLKVKKREGESIKGSLLKLSKGARARQENYRLGWGNSTKETKTPARP